MNTICATPVRLTTETVNDILARCLHIPDSNQSSEVLHVEGYKNSFSFNVDSLHREQENIEALIAQLPSNFKDGWSFWDMFRTDSGHNWTTSLKSMEALMVLGIAINKLSYLLPKEAWWSLPGGAPYLIVNN